MAIEIDLSGKTALITGGTMGIGASIAEVLHKAGANLILTGVEEDKVINDLNKKKREQGINNIQYFRVDFTNKESVDNFFLFLEQQHKIDICVIWRTAGNI
jgi:NAD(P)-dependent dehydrogenase (short-subunit alcohol dehydrogenase family)